MKKFIRITAALAVLFVVVSCRKYSSGNITYPAPQRTIRFQLYTNQDFSGNTSVINFSIFIRNANKTLFDSSLAPMRIEDVPDALHKLVIEKTVNDNADLAAGFHYVIQDVGSSSYIDTSRAGNSFKIVDYSFQ
jgi:hypothetical protein